MWRILGVLATLGLGLISCEREAIEHQPAEQVEALTHAEVVQLVKSHMSDGRLFEWNTLTDHQLYSAGVSGDSLFSYGYWLGDKAEAPTQLGRIDIDNSRWRQHFTQLLEEVLHHESIARGREVTREEVLVYGEPEFVPQATLRLTSVAAVKFLRKHKDTRYFEPMGFDPEAGALSARNSGCGNTGPSNVNYADYITISPLVKQPWNHHLHNIPQAWAHSQGDNVRIQIIDTGSSDDQENLNSQFASGLSTNRSVQRLSTHYSGSWWWRRLDSPHDPCGHGTRMAGLATAPRGSDGNAVGVAYKADLTTVRAVNDVVITSSNESKGVRDALIIAGNSSSTKIVSMSIGTPFSNGTVRDGIYYAYNRGKMLFAAAGTSLSWTSWYGVIFPATMSQTVAVTGIKEGLPFERCNTCHDGSAVDFVVHMQRRNDYDRITLSLANYGNSPAYSGGSSCATATTSGIAALVWSKYPHWSRAQVLDRLKRSANYYPGRNGNFGWGAIDALQAVTVPL